MAGLRFAFVCEDTLRDILERLEHTKVLGLGAGARTGGRRPGAHLSPGARARARAHTHSHTPVTPRCSTHGTARNRRLQLDVANENEVVTRLPALP